MNDDFDRELHSALARIEPPSGFADRLAARLPKRRGLPVWLIPLAACFAFVVVLVGYRDQELAKQQRSERQLVYALQLTSQKLAAVNQRLKRTSVHLQIQEKL